MKRLFCLALSVLLMLCALPCPAAAESAFTDVDPDAWYAPYIKVCVDSGLMVGVGDGRFAPEGLVTQAEAATLAARVHHIKNGGDGNLPQAPEEWGKMVLTFEDGESFPCYRADRAWDQEGPVERWYWTGRFGQYLYFERPQGWAGRDYQRVSLTWWGDDAVLYGQAEVPNNEGYSLQFIPGDPSQFSDLHQAKSTSPGLWYRDTDYYLLTQDLGFFCDGDYAAYRRTLAEKLDAVLAAEDLPAINHIEDYPDATDNDREMVLRFYNAGLLTGTDNLGTFSPNGYLTRAEMAAMAARVLEPELRVSFFPEGPTYRPYTLTPLEVELEQELEPLFDLESLSPDLLEITRRDEKGNWVGTTLLRADGTTLELPQGSYISQYPDSRSDQPMPLLVLTRSDASMPGACAYGVLDPATGEMVLPFGPYFGQGHCAVVENGRKFITKEATWDLQTWTPTLLRDGKGQVLYELPERETVQVDWTTLNGGLAVAYDPVTQLYGYVDEAGRWAIPAQYTDAKPFFQGRAVVCGENEEGQWAYGVIDSQGQAVLPLEYGVPLEAMGGGLYRIDPTFGSSGAWLREDGSTLQNSYLWSDVYPHNGYIALGRYFDESFQYVTPAVFDWTGPINAQNSGFVVVDGQLYRIRFDR